MTERILSRQQEVVLHEERRVLRDLASTLARTEAPEEERTTLERSIRQLDELFLLVVAGEFNSGKSTFINALLGERLLEEGVTPTTRRIHQLGWGETLERGGGPEGIERIAAPAPLLRHLEIVDTPGTNALDRTHEAITREFVPRSDLVLFVTSADRPFTESERAFIERIREWGKKLVLVVNKIDILRGTGEAEEVEGFVREHARELLGVEPEVFPVSARAALEARLEGAEPPPASGFRELERYLVETLDESERVKLKLLNPIGVARRIVAGHLEAAGARADLLRSDVEALERIDADLDLYRSDMAAEFRFRLADVDNELHAFEQRGQEFFDETVRLARAFDLVNKAKLKADFERKVIGETPRRIETKVEEIIDWMVEAELRQWQATDERLASRRTEHGDRLAGGMGRFELDRKGLLDTVGRVARSTVATYDQAGEARRMAESVQAAIAGTALLEVGAVGLGTLFTLLATTQVADVTGLLAASTMAVLGFFVLPAKRRRAKTELTAKILALRERLMSALTEQFDREIERGVHRIREAIAPYSRFVRAERERLGELRQTLDASREALENLETMIEGI